MFDRLFLLKNLIAFGFDEPRLDLFLRWRWKGGPTVEPCVDNYVLFSRLNMSTLLWILSKLFPLLGRYISSISDFIFSRLRRRYRCCFSMAV